MMEALSGWLARLLVPSAGPVMRELEIEFTSPRFFYEFFGKEAAEAWQGELPEVGWFYAAVGLFYLAVLLYFFWRFRYLEQLRTGWAESRRQRAEARLARQERRRRLAAAEAEVAGVSYDAFHALAEGNRAFDEGRHQDALSAYEEASRSEPRISAAWVGRGAALGRLGRHDEARQAFGRALELDSTNTEALVNLGLTALATEDKESARRAFARAVALHEACARGYLGLAVLAAAEGDKAHLLSNLKRALKLSPSLREEAAREPAFAPFLDDSGMRALLERFSPKVAKLRRTG